MKIYEMNPNSGYIIVFPSGTAKEEANAVADRINDWGQSPERSRFLMLTADISMRMRRDDDREPLPRASLETRRRGQLERDIEDAEYEDRERRLQDKIDALRECLTTEEIISVIPTLAEVVTRPEFAFLRQEITQ